MKITIAFEGPFNLKLEIVTSEILTSQFPSFKKQNLPLIEGREIVVQKGSQTILNRIHFSIMPDEHVVLIGPSGHGKSVLLKMMAGLFEITEGQLIFEGENWNELPITQRNRHYLKRGMVFQKNALFDSLTVRENVLFPIFETNVTDLAQEEKRALQIVEEVGLSHALDLFPHELSGGMQKRLGLARALALRPQILLADDPVAGLDPITSRNIVKLIQRLQSEFNTTCVSVLNDINRALELATRILIVIDGQVADLGPPETALKTSESKFKKFLNGEPEQ